MGTWEAVHCSSAASLAGSHLSVVITELTQSIFDCYWRCKSNQWSLKRGTDEVSRSWMCWNIIHCCGLSIRECIYINLHRIRWHLWCTGTLQPYVAHVASCNQSLCCFIVWKQSGSRITCFHFIPKEMELRLLRTRNFIMSDSSKRYDNPKTNHNPKPSTNPKHSSTVTIGPSPTLTWIWPDRLN